VLPVEFLEVRLGDARALVRNVDKDLRTISFDYGGYSVVDLLDEMKGCLQRETALCSPSKSPVLDLDSCLGNI
jgi:hypothetical protein